VNEARFQYYEIVRIREGLPGKQELGGLEGAILGMSQEANGSWGYAVSLYSDGYTYHVTDCEIEPTGRMDRRESFYDGTSVRVSVDLETGEGSIIGHNDGASEGKREQS
jgi:hypothetical protein